MQGLINRRGVWKDSRNIRVEYDDVGAGRDTLEVLAPFKLLEI
jgi:hypothetical protein